MTLPTPRVEVGEGDIACPLTSTLLSKLPPSDPIFERGKRNSYLSAMSSSTPPSPSPIWHLHSGSEQAQVPSTGSFQTTNYF